MGKRRKIKRVVLDTNVILSALLFKGKLSNKGVRFIYFLVTLNDEQISVIYKPDISDGYALFRKYFFLFQRKQIAVDFTYQVFFIKP